MFLPSKIRYCEPCGFAINEQREKYRAAKSDAQTDMSEPPTARPAAAAVTPKGDYVERAIHSKLVDKVFDLEKRLASLEQRLDALEQI
jgi:uncharacterized protein YceH (UPF0502 family)